MAQDARRRTLVEIAADAGVSVSAVSKVLNGRTDVAAGTRARIASLLRQHGYQVPSRLGFGVVDLLIADLHIPWADILRTLRDGGYTGWLSSEYEGRREPYRGREQVRRQHALLRSLAL